MNLFVDSEIELTVKLHVYGSVFWTDNNSANKPEKLDETKHKIYTLNFRLPTYADEIDLSDTSVQLDGTGRMHIVTNQIRFKRFARLLKKWDLTGKNGDVLPISPENIGSLNPDIGAIIADDLESQLTAP